MFSAGSVEDFARLYSQDGRGALQGVWSVLIADSADRSADFARRYCQMFNEIVLSSWHLAVYAKDCRSNDGYLWSASSELHEHVVALRGQLKAAGEEPPKLGILFFDPDVGVFDLDTRSVLIPLDHQRIGDSAFFRAGFEATHRCIMKAFDRQGLNPYRDVPSKEMEGMLRQIHRQLTLQTIKSYLTRPLIALSNAGLGALVGKLL